MKLWLWPKCSLCGHTRSYTLKIKLNADQELHSDEWTTPEGEAVCGCHAAMVQEQTRLQLFPCDVMDPP